MNKKNCLLFAVASSAFLYAQSIEGTIINTSYQPVTDTEDREAKTNWYFILSQKTKVDIKSDLNKWLYDFDPN